MRIAPIRQWQRRRRARGGAGGGRRIVVPILLLLITAAAVLLHFHQNDSSLYQDGSQSSQKWAYVFVLAGCDSEHPSYLGPLLNILVATHVLKHQFTSRADVVVLVQMKYHSKFQALPLDQQEWLTKLGIQIRYLPPPTRVLSFYELIAQKLQAFQLTDYDRVMVLDADVLPLCNLDYLFDLSSSRMDATAAPTILHAMYDDPVNAGLFVITPSNASYQQLEDIIRDKSPDQRLPPQEWNSKEGWGSPIEYRLWNNATKLHSGWDFYCAGSDQGLLLYWAKVVQKQVTIIAGDVIEHTDGVKLSLEPNNLQRYSCLPTTFDGDSNMLQNSYAANASPRASQLGFYRDFYHAVGLTKPWEIYMSESFQGTSTIASTTQYWHVLLDRVVRTHKLTGVPQGAAELRTAIPPPLDRGDLFAIGKKPEA